MFHGTSSGSDSIANAAPAQNRPRGMQSASAIPSGIWMHSTKVENSALRPKLAQKRGAVIRSRNHSAPIQKRDCRVKISKNE